MTVHFKHVYGSDVADWGAIGFPSSQPAGTALGGYRRGEQVLLAIPESAGEPALRGMIFARCTLLHLAGSTRSLANQDMVRASPKVAARWHSALPIHRLWLLNEPVSYKQFDHVAHAAMSGRGRLVPVENMDEFVVDTPAIEVPVYQSDWVRERLAA